MASKDFVVKNGLVVDGTFNVNSTALYYGTGTTNTTINTTSASIGANSTTTAFLVASNGNIGVGNTAPSTKFSVNGTTFLGANVTIAAALTANGGVGTAGQVLTSNSVGTYWSTVVTSVASGNGLTGGPVTNTGTLSVLANNGIVANSTGLFVNTAYIATLAANSATYANLSVSNTFTIGTASYFVANGNFGIGNSAPADKLRVEGNASFSGNITGPGTSATLDGFFIDCGVYT